MDSSSSSSTYFGGRPEGRGGIFNMRKIKGNMSIITLKTFSAFLRKAHNGAVLDLRIQGSLLCLFHVLFTYNTIQYLKPLQSQD